MSVSSPHTDSASSGPSHQAGAASAVSDDVAESGASAPAAAVTGFVWNRRQKIQTAISLVLLVGLLVTAYVLHNADGYGSQASISLLIGASLGIVFERGRFCFFCIFRDYIEDKNSQGMMSVLAAIAVGSIGYVIVFGQFLPDPSTGRLAPTAHIGPLAWTTVMAGLVFGIGMALSGACISGHLYRLGQGYTRAIPALLATLVGFGLGFLSWNTLYRNGLSNAPVPWLPNWLGYGGALLLQLALLGGLAVLFLKRLPAREARPATRITASEIRDNLVVRRWPAGITGAIVGIIGVVAYLRVEPLGVTRQIGTLSRTWLEDIGLVPEHIYGMDVFRGCITVVSTVIVNNGWLIIGLVVASFVAALSGGRFKPSKLTVRGTGTAIAGGLLLGWSAMIGLGCTVGVLLSGTQALAVTGWVFGAAIFIGTWIAIRLGLHRLD